MSTPSASRTRAPRAKSALPSLVATGATPKTTSVAEVICPAAPRRAGGMAQSSHQTHGAVTQMNGPVTNVSQLTNGGRNIAKGSSGSFTTLAAYTSHLKTLALHELRRHAIEDARIVPIDDRDRLIRRLETQWTTTAAKQPWRAANAAPARVPFTQAQLEAQAEIRNRLLRT